MANRVSNNLIKEIRKLHAKKYRQEKSLFLVDRWKNIMAFVENDWEILYVFYTQIPPVSLPGQTQAFQISKDKLRRMSPLQNPYDALAVVRKREVGSLEMRGIIPVLDGIQDPGNLGTIIRTCDWFGIDQLVCLPGTADVYNPKTVQAAMGALARVRVFYQEAGELFEKCPFPVWGADMEGDNLFETTLEQNIFMVFGNEGHGIRKNTAYYVNKRLRIPHGQHKISESLNVSVSAGIILGEWFRQNFSR